MFKAEPGPLLHHDPRRRAAPPAQRRENVDAGPEAPFASVLALASARMPFVLMRFLLKDPFRSDLRVGKVHGPVVIVHGTGDGTIPVSEGHRLADLGPEGTVFDALPGDHVSILGVGDAEFEPVFQRAIGGCAAP